MWRTRKERPTRLMDKVDSSCLLSFMKGVEIVRGSAGLKTPA